MKEHTLMKVELIEFIYHVPIDKLFVISDMIVTKLYLSWKLKL